MDKKPTYSILVDFESGKQSTVCNAMLATAETDDDEEDSCLYSESKYAFEPLDSSLVSCNFNKK